MSEYLFERDLLYPTDNIMDPGSLHVKILNPNNSRMPVIVEPKSHHSAVENVNVVLDVLQKDIFDRINIRIYDKASVFIMLKDVDKAKYGDVKYINVVFKSVHLFLLEPVNDVV